MQRSAKEEQKQKNVERERRDPGIDDVPVKAGEFGVRTRQQHEHDTLQHGSGGTTSDSRNNLNSAWSTHVRNEQFARRSHVASSEHGH